MRIAVTADPYIPVPPRIYGGIERIVGLLVEGLVERGHDVVLLGHPDSEVNAELVPYGAARHGRPLDRARELYQVGSWLWRHRAQLDVVHSFGRLAALFPILPVSRLLVGASPRRPRLSRVGTSSTISRCRPRPSGVNKPLLVSALAEPLPREVWDRPKQGFTLPFRQFMLEHRGELRTRARASELYQRDAVDQVWNDFESGRAHWSRSWALVAFNGWVERLHSVAATIRDEPVLEMTPQP